MLLLCAGRKAPAAAVSARPQKHSYIDQDSVAPDFTLLDAHSDPAKPTSITLSQLAKSQPVLLIFYLGYSCPRCMESLRELDEYKAQFDATGVQIVAIGPNTVEELRNSIEQYGDFPFPMLSDPEGKVAEAYDLRAGGPGFARLFSGRQGSQTIRFAMQSSHPYDNYTASVELVPGIKE